MKEEHFSPEQSLQLIQSMINKTRNDLSGNAHYFLVWGWITFVACVGQFVLKHLLHYPRHYEVWMLIIVGIIYSVYAGIKDGRNKKIRTYVGESMQYLWTGMGITFMVLSIVLTKMGWGNSVFPFFIILYALGTFVSGCILKFRPLVIGGIIAWAIAIASVFLSYDYQMLAGAAAILVSYIVPAHMLAAKRKKESS